MLLIASIQLRRKAIIAAVPLGAAQLAWLIATAVILLRTDHDAGAGGGGIRELGEAEPGEPEPGGGLSSSASRREMAGDDGEMHGDAALHAEIERDDAEIHAEIEADDAREMEVAEL